MIIGIGTDIIEIKRISKAIERSSFLKGCYTATELEILSGKGYSSYAGYFCAKEATVKALGVGFTGGIRPNHIEVVHTKHGKPTLSLYKKALDEAKKNGVKKIHVSISHSMEYATAIVILES